MSKKLKWTPKTQHFTRYYNLGIWCAVLDHQENVAREVSCDSLSAPSAPGVGPVAWTPTPHRKERW